LNEPPDWLRKHLVLCRQDQAHYLKSTASAIATEVYDDADRAEEVKPVLVAYLNEVAS
jgi:hypothetical protein